MTGTATPHPLRAFDESPSYTSPERRLMLATITNAIADARGNAASCNPGERNRAQREALAWFRAGGPDFQTVCYHAGLDPAHTRRAVLEFIASGEPMPTVRRFVGRGKGTIDQKEAA